MKQGNKIKNDFLQLLRRMPFVVIFFLSISTDAATYYSRNSANWNVNSTWSTVGYGGASATGYPGVNDTAKIGNTYTITINTNSSCAQLDIGQGTSGVVQYSGAGTYTLTVGGNITVNTGGSLIYNTNSSKTHILQIGGNFTNQGNVDLYYDANDIVNITFNTAKTSIISGSGTWALNNATINKTTSAVIVEVQVNAFETAINTLTATTGNYIHNNSGSYSVNSGSASDYAINQNMIFTVPQGSMWFSPISNRTYLYGSLYITGGNVYIGSTAGNNGMRYDKVGSNVPTVEISSGTLTVYGGISYASGAGTNPFVFRMTGGTVLLNNGSNGTSVEAFLVNDATSSVFYMSAGTITIQDHNSSPGNNCTDWGVCGTNGTVTSIGGTVQFGNNSTPAGTNFDFIPYPNVEQPNFKVSGPLASSVTLQTSKSATADFKLLSLYIDSNKTFDIQSILGVPGNSKTMTLTKTFDGIYGFYSKGTFNARAGTVVMGSTEAQSMGGSSSATFYNLTISNAANVTLETTENVSSLLTMNSGLLNTTATNIITCTSTADATMGSASSYVNGPMIQTVATSSTTTRNFPLGKSGNYRPAILSVRHSNNTSVTYNGEMINSSATALGYTKPPAINKVSYTRYWNFVRQNVANFTNANMTLYYSVDDSVSNKNNLAVVHDGGSSNWVDYGGSGTSNITGSITSNSISSFKTKFALGFPPAPLPIELINFTATKKTNSVLCEWETASETNNAYFYLERSNDGINFEMIYSTKGAGNSLIIMSYYYKDENPLQGDSYYRLKQTDFDGKNSYSDIEFVFIGSIEEKYTVFPNPSAGMLHVTKQGLLSETTMATVYDFNGKQIPATVSLSKQKNELTIEIDPGATTSNQYYILNLITPEGIEKEMILVEKK